VVLEIRLVPRVQDVDVGGMGVRRIAVLAAALVGLGLLTGPGTAGSPGHPQVRALFFGDSLVAGTGATPPRPVQVRTAADRLGWEAVVDARGGTGWTTGGSKGRPYLDRLQHDGFLKLPYDVIVLEGGTNDAHHGSPAKVREAALRTIDYVHRRQPWARIVLVGAFAPQGQPLERYQEVDTALVQVAAERGLRYVSQLHYSRLTDAGFLSRDRFHPGDAGYALMGRELAQALKG
jgi:lysophospholipase L1-like esterase